MKENDNKAGTAPVDNDKFIINVGRQLGSGGRQIGRLLAKEFGIAYFDKEILTLAAKESGFCEEIFQRNDEKIGFFNSMFGNVMPVFGSMEGDYYGNQMLFYGSQMNQMSDENLFRIQSDAIRKVASERSCIFIGRCADYVLRDFPRCVNVFVSADEEDRIARIMKLDNVTEKEARKMMAQGDSKRADFYNFYSSGEWGAAKTYHLCINSSILGIEGTASFIKEFVKRKLEAEKK